VLARLVPEMVVVTETREDRLDADLHPVERAVLGRAVERRRREFVTGRACARQALRALGAPVAAIGAGANGEPLWPDGVVGSITHCDGFRAAAVAWAADFAALGIDAEPDAPLPDGVFEDIAHGAERAAPERGRLLFSAKEAVYKAWCPLTGRWLGFEDAEVTFTDAGFRARLHVPGPVVDGVALTELHGRWAVEDGVLCTAVVVPRRTLPTH
jgi:4'-phosphopantetheinyl transferase EntD